MRLAHKLIAGYVVIAIITAGAGLVGMLAAAKLKASYEHLALGGLPIHKTLGQLKFAGLRIVSSTSEAVVLMGEKNNALPINQVSGAVEGGGVLLDELKLIDAGKSLFYKAIGEYSSAVKNYDPEAEKYIEPIEQFATELLDASFSLLVTKKTDETGKEVDDAKKRFEEAEKLYLNYLDSLISAKDSSLEEKLQYNVRFYANAFSIIILLGTISLLTAFTFGIFQAKGIADNLSELTRKAELIGHGNLDQIVESKTNDELGELARTFNKMSTELKESSTERDNAQQDLQRYAVQLENNTRELQDIVSVASHDLQEPLRKIMTYSDRLMYECDTGISDDAVQYLRRMNSSAGKMRILLDDLLEYSKLNSRELIIGNVDLNKLIDNVSDSVRKTFGTEEIDFIYDSQLPIIECDMKLMGMLFFNLFENSFQFSRVGVKPLVTITAEMLEGNHKITVQDNGQGFQQKFADRIFCIFEKLHSDERYEGNGVGLALCRKIMEKHGGEISAEGQEGIGTKIFITLPKNLNKRPV